MCGIFAMIYSSPSHDQRYLEECKKSFHLLEKRGPDSGSFIIDENKIICFQRLSIIDIGFEGNQPMLSDNGNMLMCNGEIFNFETLKTKYSVQCTSNSDCEVILDLYNKQLLPTVINSLNGDFAFFIEDIVNNKIILGRDRVGVRPLFYGFTPEDDFVVASEVKCLSMCTDICHVLPGTLLTFDKRTTRITEMYYVKETFPTQDLKTLLYESTRLRLMSERPIGCLLSGGVDSSIVASILCKLLGPENVRTYSIGMEGSLDLHYASKVALFLGTNHTQVLFTPQEGIEAIPEVIYNLESFDITTVRASVGMYLLARYISMHTDDKVIFSGEGADELLCGYLYFHYAPTPLDAHEESMRLISEMYKYDVLRADRCISCNGLELRVPFLDPSILSFCINTPGELKAPNGDIEKKLLREQFIGELPDDVLWRRKDGFSDGVSSYTKSWYEYIKEYTDYVVTEDVKDKESFYYKQIYDSFFPFYPSPVSYMWMPKWIKTNNPSGRTLKVYKDV